MPRGFGRRATSDRVQGWFALNALRPFRRGPDDERPWDDPEWEPPGGWQEGSEDIQELEYLTHEEMIDYFDDLAEAWDVDVDDIWEMYREAMGS